MSNKTPEGLSNKGGSSKNSFEEAPNPNNPIHAAKLVNQELDLDVAKKRVRTLCTRFWKNELPMWNGLAKSTLGNQLWRALVSIPSNIAEGYGRNSKKDYIRFL